MSIYLAVDSSSNTTYLGLRIEDSVEVSRKSEKRILQLEVGEKASALASCISQFLSSSGVSIKQINGLIVGDGPGSFTGLRVSWSLFKALAITLSCPLVSVCSLRIRAHSLIGKVPVIAVNRGAGRQKFFACGYDLEGSEKLKIGVYTQESLLKEMERVGLVHAQIVSDDLDVISELEVNKPSKVVESMYLIAPKQSSEPVAVQLAHIHPNYVQAVNVLTIEERKNIVV